MDLHGKLLGKYELTDDSFVQFKADESLLYVNLSIKKDSSSALNIVGCLRPIGQSWSDSDYLRLQPEYEEKYNAMTLEEIIAFWGLSVTPPAVASAPQGSSSIEGRNAIDTFTWQSVPINDRTCPRDEEMERYIRHYQQATSEKYDRVITRFSQQLTHPLRNQETSLGNLIADILRDSLGIDLMLMGSGAIRSYTLGPVVHYADLVECLPYDDAVYMLHVTGAQLTRMLRHILRDEAFHGEHTEFYQFSHGMRIVWSRSRQAFRELTLDGQPLHNDRLYTVAVQKYHFTNLKAFLDITPQEAEENAKVRVLTTSARDVIEEYLSVNPHLSRSVEGRLVVEP